MMQNQRTPTKLRTFKLYIRIEISFSSQIYHQVLVQYCEINQILNLLLFSMHGICLVGRRTRTYTETQPTKVQAIL